MGDPLEKFRILYQKGISAIKSQNWDYAIALFGEALDMVPDHAEARSNLRISEFRKFETHKLQIWYKIHAGIFNIIPAIKALFYKRKKDWYGVMREIEKPLKIYPKNTSLLRDLAKAAENAGLTETACGVYETIYIIKPTDVETLKKLGFFYHKLSRMDKARYYYEKAFAIAPMDYEARKGLQDIAALGTIAKGWDDTTTYRGKILDEEKADIFEKELKLVSTEKDKNILIKEYENILLQKPRDIITIKKLAGLYTATEKYDKALQLYEKIELKDPDIRKEILNIKILKFKDSPEIGKQLMFEDTKARVKEFPTHLPLRYEMGSVYMDNGQIDQAIGEFQISVKDPKYRILSFNSLGMCFHKKGYFDLAINQFQKANNELHNWDELKKEVIYNLGNVYEALGEKGKALAEYKKIYEQDIHYRDISKKIA